MYVIFLLLLILLLLLLQKKSPRLPAPSAVTSASRTAPSPPADDAPAQFSTALLGAACGD